MAESDHEAAPGAAEEEEEEYDAYTVDGAVHYVGPVLGKGGKAFKPTFPVNGLHELVINLAPNQVNACPELQGLYQHADAYNNKKSVVRVFTSDQRSLTTPGSACILTPEVDGKVIACTARHVVAGVTDKSLITCTDQAYADLQALAQRPMQACVINVPDSLPTSVSKDQHNLPKPSSPNKNLACTSTIPLRDADVVFLEIDWPHGHPSPDYMTACTSLEMEDLVSVFAHQGTPDNIWKQSYCMTPEEHAAVPALSEQEALQRYEQLNGWAIHPDYKCVAPGTVHNLNRYVVEHTCSVCPGTSGGAGVLLDAPNKMVFFHNVSQGYPRRAWAYGTRVTHPVFAYMYLRYALPKLTLAPMEHVSDRAEEINAYIKYFQASLEEWGLSETVRSFQSRFPPA